MNKRNGTIDFYRFVFSLVIASSHSYFLQGRIEGDIEHYVPFLGGYTAVEFFFILSGYLLTQKAYNIQQTDRIYLDTWNEIIKRVKSLYPAFICAYIISVCTFHHVNGGNIIDLVKLTIGELTLLMAAGFIFLDTSFLATIWFFSALLIGILILFPFMAKYKKTFSTVIAPIIVILGYGYFARVNGNITAPTEPSAIISSDILRSCFGLSFGNIVYYLSQKDKIEFGKLGKTCLKLLEIIVFISTLYLMNHYTTDYNDFIETMLFSILILLAFRNDHSKFIFDNKIMNILGKYSATLYVVHYSIIWIPKHIWPESWAMEYIMWMLMTNAISIIIHLFVKIIFPRIKFFVTKIIINT